MVIFCTILTQRYMFTYVNYLSFKARELEPKGKYISYSLLPDVRLSSKPKGKSVT